MSIELTISSAREFNQIRMGHMTPAMAADYLKTGRLEMRPFADILRTFYPHEDLQPRLFAAFLRDDPDAVPSSVARTIRNWLSGRNKPTDRFDIFHIAFALGLSEANADYLLGFCTGCGIHYREGADVVFAWFLRGGKTWREAKEFYASLPPEPRLTLLPPTYTTGTQLTQELKKNFLQAHTTDELLVCYLNNLDNFGSLHLRAFHYFNRFMDQLIHPSSAWGGDREEDYSIDTVMDTYLSLHMPSGRKRQDYARADFQIILSVNERSKSHRPQIHHNFAVDGAVCHGKGAVLQIDQRIRTVQISGHMDRSLIQDESSLTRLALVGKQISLQGSAVDQYGSVHVPAISFTAVVAFLIGEGAVRRR